MRKNKKKQVYKPGSVPFNCTLYLVWCLSLISERMLPCVSLASYPPTHASNAQTPVYLELQPAVCSFHITRLCSSDQTLLPDGR